MTCVLDASAALSLVIADEFDTDSERILDYLLKNGAVVPSLWNYEISNGLLAAMRRGRLTERGVAHALIGLERLPIEHTTLRPANSEIIGVAQHHRLTTYDASYLWLAQHIDRPLATVDRGLHTAARSAGLELVV